MRAWVGPFLRELEAGATIIDAARIAGVTRQNVYAWRGRSIENQRRIDAAIESSNKSTLLARIERLERALGLERGLQL